MHDALMLDKEKKQLICKGQWTLPHITFLKTTLAHISWPEPGLFEIDGQAITAMDSAGAWLLLSLIKQLEQQGFTFRFIHFNAANQHLLTLIRKKLPTEPAKTEKKAMGRLAWLGQYAIQQMQEFRHFLRFIGYLSLEVLRIIKHPRKHFRFPALVSVIDKGGYQALPIIGVLAFMVGVVIAYQLSVQLRTYGANIYIVDLLGLSILREFAPLITSIMVAGRTGSAFTAQLGMMKLTQEIDALNTMGVTPAELLLLPRLLGLLLALPLLTVWFDIFGVLGGMVMANNMLGVTWHDFLQRFQYQIPLRALIIGIGKTPVFAFIIGSIGCYQGMRISGGAMSVGARTTKSVVLAIFFIIVADAVFSVIFSKLGL